MDFLTHLQAHYPKEVLDPLWESLQQKAQSACLLHHQRLSDETFLAEFGPLKKHPIVEHAYLYDKDSLPLGKHLFHQAGGYYLQEPSAMVVASLLPLDEEDHILDLCAAPGGKTIQLAFRHPKGIIVSNDISYSRASVLSQNVERFGLKNVIVTCMDPHRFPMRFQSSFDAIVLDAPCSGSGMFRKNEEMKADWTYEKVLGCAKVQSELMDVAASLLKEGGYLLYSTCSFSYEEDDGNVIAFLARHDDFEIVPLPSSPLFYEHPNGLGTIHLFPHLFPGEGHYIALLRKKGEKKQNQPGKTRSFSIGKESYWPIYQGELIIKNGMKYVLPFVFPLDHMTILRPGLSLGEEKKDYFVPALALARSLSWDRDIPLTYQEAALYIHGEVLSFPHAENGFHTVSYLGLPLGFIKMVNGQGKNYYPKGLRK